MFSWDCIDLINSYPCPIKTHRVRFSKVLTLLCIPLTFKYKEKNWWEWLIWQLLQLEIPPSFKSWSMFIYKLQTQVSYFLCHPTHFSNACLAKPINHNRISIAFYDMDLVVKIMHRIKACLVQIWATEGRNVLSISCVWMHCQPFFCIFHFMTCESKRVLNDIRMW